MRPSPRIALFCLSLAATACLQDKAAPIVEKGDLFYGRDGVYDKAGKEVPRYDNHNRAALPPEKEPKYKEKRHQYGVDAATSPVLSSDLPPPGAEPASRATQANKQDETRLLPLDWSEQTQTKARKQQKTTQFSAERRTSPASPQATQKDSAFARADQATPAKQRIAVGTLEPSTPPPKPEIAPLDLEAPQSSRAEEQASSSSQQEAKTAPPQRGVEQIEQATRYPATDQQEMTVSSQTDAGVDFVWPLRGSVEDDFAATGEEGVTLAGRVGEPVRAAASGTVVFTGNKLKDYGNMVIIQHENGYVTTYGHLSDSVVSEESDVLRGQLIGFVGKSGNTDEPKLHFSIRKGNKAVNPVALMTR